MLPHRDFETRLGRVRLWGRLDSFDAARPMVLAITGLFANPGLFMPLPDYLTGCDVVVARLPGMLAPHLSEPSVARFAAAFDDVMEREFAGRRLLRIGASVGGLVALAMRQGDAVVALDPPLTTSALWPLWPILKERLAATDDPRLSEWLWNVVGYSWEKIENRDYRPFFKAARGPGFVLVAGDPLEPKRPLARLPGLMTAEDREMVRRAGNLRALFVPASGHNIPYNAAPAMEEALRCGLSLLPT